MSGLADLSLDEVIRLTSGSKPGRKQRGPRQGYGRPRGVHKRPDRPVYSSRFRSGQQNFGSLRGFQAANNRSGIGASGDAPPTRLIVDNLADGVTESDLVELFSEHGNVIGASLHFDKTGRGLGTAHVTFSCKASALQAMHEYNGVTLDGLPMNIQLMPSTSEVEVEPNPLPTPSPTTISISSGSSYADTLDCGGNNFNRRRSKFGRPTPKFERSIPSESQLDNDLDQYMAKRVKTKEDLDREMEAYQAQKIKTEITEDDTAMLYD